MSNLNTEKCLEIIRLSNNGDQLSPRHLKLVEITVNLNGNLSQLGQQELDRVYGLVKAGTYCDWFHGIENLTQGHDGYVYWKGHCVEHFSFHGDISEVEKLAAEELADRCRHLEAINAPICIANTICKLEEIQLGGQTAN